MPKIKLTLEEASNIVETGTHVATDGWRWGTVESYVFERDGKTYRADIRFHSEEGAQTEYGIDAYEVKPVVVTTTDWVRVKDEPPTP